MKEKIPGGKYAANQLITLRVTPEEKKELMERVSIVGVSLSAYVRHRIIGGRPIIPRVDEAMIRELRRQGGLLKHNFETLRQAKVGRDFIRQHEQLLDTISNTMEKLGSVRHDSKEIQEPEKYETESAADR